MSLKIITLRLLFLCVLPFCCFGQSKFVKHKIRYLSLAKEPQSIKRDTLMILELDSLILFINDTDRKFVEKFDEIHILNLLKKHTQNSDWAKGKAIYNLWFAVHGLHFSGQHIKAFKYFTLAESQFEKLKDYNRQALTLIRMGLHISLRYKGVYDELKYIEKAISVAKKAKNNRHLFNALNAKGEYYFTKNDFVNALKVYKEHDSLNDPKKINNLGNKLNIGVTLLQLDSLEKALSYIIPTLKMIPNESAHEKYLHWVNYTELINYYLKKQNFVEAKKYLLKLEEYKSTEDIKVTYPKLVYEVEKGLGNHKVALEAFEEYQRYLLEDRTKLEKNSVEGIKSQVALHQQTEKLQKAELEKLRSENAKQEQQQWFWIIIGATGLLSAFYIFRMNKILRKNNEELASKNAAISAALLQGQATERKRLADDLHDSLGSTMSALRWSMEAINPQKLSPQEQEVYRHVQNTIAQAHDQVRLLSHNLLPEELEKQGLWEALRQLISKLNRNTPVKWTLTLPHHPPRFDAKMEFELYSIVLELTNNTLKHAQATEGNVMCQRIYDQWHITVSDNGVGLAEKRTYGKGMNSVESRVKSLNGQLHIHTQAGEGTRFEVWV